MLLEVSTSDESCLRVCVKLREASANARVSSTGRVSHVSQPTHPVTPQPGEALVAAAAAAGPLLLVALLLVALLLLLVPLVLLVDGFSTLIAVGVEAKVEADDEGRVEAVVAGWVDAVEVADMEAALAAAANNEGDGARDVGGVGSI